MDLTDNEATDLQRYFPLYKNWGYRTGEYRAHEKFELESGEFRWVQEFTDILFRNLSQLDMDDVRTMRPSDFDNKVKSASCIIDYVDKSEMDRGMNLVKKFLQQASGGGRKRKAQTIDLTQNSNSNSKKPKRETNRMMLEDLADTNLENASVMYACFIYAAKSILALSDFRPQAAQDIMKECLTNYFSQDGGKAMYRGRMRKIHSGPRNGRYFLMKGKKIYV